MSTDFAQNYDRSDESPTPTPGGMGQSEAEWDIFDAQNMNITADQLRAIHLSIQGLGDVQIAQLLKVDRKTIWRWKNFNPDYRAALDHARFQVRADIVNRYQCLILLATQTLASLLKDPEPNNRFRAAYALLTMSGSFKPAPPPPAQPSPPEDEPMPRLEPKVG